MTGKVDVLAVIESCRNRLGVLDDKGRSLESSYRYALRCRGLHCEHEAWDAVEYEARNVQAAAASLRSMCRVPVTLLGRASRRRAALSTTEAR